jgi:hypothetical protein
MNPLSRLPGLLLNGPEIDPSGKTSLLRWAGLQKALRNW